MADYAVLLTELKAELKAEDSAVIGFGGSYGVASFSCSATRLHAYMLHPCLLGAFMHVPRWPEALPS